MPALVGLCVKYFNSKDLYDVLEIDKKATEKEIKKAYHRLSLKVHPDRVAEEEKLEATEKFKVLGKVHSILSDRAKKALYDETGTFDEDEDEISERNWMAYWRMLFKPITEEDIVAYEKDYKGSELELRDLKKAYLQGKGDMDYITDSTPFATVPDEPRIVGLIQKMIDDGEVPAYDLFTDEPAKKKTKRHNKAMKEAQEVDNLKKMVEIEKNDAKENDLTVMILQRQESRAEKMDSFLDKLAEKYGGNTSKSPKGKGKSPKAKKATAGVRSSLRNKK